MKSVTILIVVIAIPLTAFADDAVQLTFDPADDRFPRWSPNGTTIAFSSDRLGDYDIYTIPATGGSADLIFSSSVGDYQPEWSPDNSTIVFFRTGSDELWKIPSTGGTATRFTYNNLFDYSPSWSDDDTKVAFHGHSAKGDPNSQNDNTVFWVPANDGSAEPYLIITGWDNTSPEWAPNSSNKITLTRDPGDNLDQIWVKTLGGAAYAVTDDSFDNVKSSWSPGGQYLAYGSDRSGNDDIWIIPAAGGTPIQVTDNPADDFHPDWSPNSNRIVFTSRRSGGVDVYIIDVSSLVNIESASLGEIKARFATEEMKGK